MLSGVSQSVSIEESQEVVLCYYYLLKSAYTLNPKPQNRYYGFGVQGLALLVSFVGFGSAKLFHKTHPKVCARP